MPSNVKREKRPPSPEDDDVIILSDNDSPSPPMNGLSHFKELDTDLLMVTVRSLVCQPVGFFNSLRISMTCSAEEQPCREEEHH